jgi:hypothetical protein
MATVVEEIPQALRAEVDAGLAFVNRERGASFRVTGLVDPNPGLAGQGDARELSLVLCDGDLCTRERLQVTPNGAGFDVAFLEDSAEDLPAHLDPPAGVRKTWLAGRLAEHSFVVLIFYRGLW